MILLLLFGWDTERIWTFRAGLHHSRAEIHFRAVARMSEHPSDFPFMGL